MNRHRIASDVTRNQKGMKPRHNRLERVGLHFIAQIIEDEFGWIFREQSVSDVGIDAVVEHCNNGDPSGKLIALQIKSGKGNVKKPKMVTLTTFPTHTITTGSIIDYP